MNHLLYPTREYITQIARFNRSKGIPYDGESYRKLCDRIICDAPERLLPQCMICQESLAQTTQPPKHSRYAAIAKDVVVARIGSSDQVLNAMITTAKIVLQLSLRKGFEVKVSEALHRGKPVVATRANLSNFALRTWLLFAPYTFTITGEIVKNCNFT
ncbi:hypothetical protein HOY82DRAFT_649656 [Tuber indicum]|nr:hypothetical protein HOY82DRAFT_649656 [Tuber indicum]